MSIVSNIKIATHRSTLSQAVSAGAIALVGLTLAAAQASPAPQSRAEDNKRIVIDFYEAGLNRKDFAAASRHFGQQYIQHNPMSSDGRDGFAKFLEYLRKEYPSSHSSIRQAFADADYVILHVLENLRPDDSGNAIVDIFRLEDGKIVEHWDVKQPIPSQAANRNGMF